MAAARHRPIHRLRRVLLVLLVLLAAALVALYLFGRAGKPGREGTPEPEEGATPEGAITLIGEGFEFTHSEGERPIFRIRGDAIRADRGGTVYLDGVGLTLYDEDGTGYEVAADRATYNRDEARARLAGEVVLSGPDNTRLRTRGMRLVHGGSVLVSTGPVRFDYQDLHGRADGLRIERETDAYLLTGNVVVESSPHAETPMSLTRAAHGLGAPAPPDPGAGQRRRPGARRRPHRGRADQRLPRRREPRGAVPARPPRRQRRPGGVDRAAGRRPAGPRGACASPAAACRCCATSRGAWSMPSSRARRASRCASTRRRRTAPCSASSPATWWATSATAC